MLACSALFGLLDATSFFPSAISCAALFECAFWAGARAGEGMEDDDEGLNGLAPERVALNLSLHLAAADGNYEECLTLLKDEGADAWWEDQGALNWSALHWAAEGGHTKVVKLLLRRGALWNAGGCYCRDLEFVGVLMLLLQSTASA